MFTATAIASMTISNSVVSVLYSVVIVVVPAPSIVIPVLVRALGVALAVPPALAGR